MKKIIFLALITLLVISCKEKKNKPSHEISQFEIFTDEILTAFPGGIYYLDNNIVWFDPFTSDNFLHILDIHTGVEIGAMGKIGQGPNEFVAPSVDNVLWNGLLYVYDASGKTKGYFSVNKALNHSDPFLPLTREDSIIRLKGYTIRLDDSLYIGRNLDGNEKAYKLYSSGKENNFGNYVLKKEKKHFTAFITYNPQKKLLIIASYPVEYIACYKKEADNFKLIWEKAKEPQYTKSNDVINFDRTRCGVYDLTLTKDFIVAIQRDYERDKTNEAEVGRDINKLPHTLFIYNYDGDLLKIINYGVPIGRIAGNYKTNIIYAIIADPDFKIGKSILN